MNLNNLDNFQCKLIIFSPLLFLTGPFISDLLVSFVSFVFLITIFYQKKFYLLKNKFLYLFIIWNLYLILRSIFSVDPLHSLESSLFYFRFGFFALAVGYYINISSQSKKYLLYCVSLCIAFLFIDSIIQYNFKYNLFGLPKLNPHRVSSVFGEELIMGSYVSRLYPLILGLIFLTINSMKNKIIFFIPITIISIVTILMSGERTALVMIVMYLILFLFYGHSSKLNIYLIATIIVTFLISIFVQDIRERTYSRTFAKMFTNDNFYIFSYDHHAHYVTATKMFLKNPIFGIGTKNFRILCDKEEYEFLVQINQKETINGCQNHPHNFYIQLLAETGIVGSIPVILIYFMLVFVFLKHIYFRIILKKKSSINLYSYILYSSILVNFLPFIPSGNFFGNYINCLIYLPIGFLLQEIYFNKKYL